MRHLVIFNGNSIPPAGSPMWADATLPLLTKLQESAMTIDEIIAWSRKLKIAANMIRNMVGWLSLSDLIYYDVGFKIWRFGPNPPEEFKK